MRKKRIRWFVTADAQMVTEYPYWWQGGRWTLDPDRSRPFSSHAVLRTRQGALRCARRCAAPYVRLLCRYKDGTFREWRWHR